MTKSKPKPGPYGKTPWALPKRAARAKPVGDAIRAAIASAEGGRS